MLHRSHVAPGASIRTPGVESPRRVLTMLLAFSEERPEATIRELANEIGAPLSTAYRYVALLRELGLLEEATPGRYRVGPRVHAVARASARADTLGQLVRPRLEELTAATGETTMLVRVIADAAVCVYRMEPPRAVRLSVQPGQPLPLHTGASGKALLASLGTAERERLLALGAAADPQLSMERLRTELEDVAVRGWAESSGEIDDGIWACAVAIEVPGEPLAAISLAGPAYRIVDGRRAEIRATLLRVAKDLSGSRGGSLSRTAPRPRQ